MIQQIPKGQAAFDRHTETSAATRRALWPLLLPAHDLAHLRQHLPRVAWPRRYRLQPICCCNRLEAIWFAYRLQTMSIMDYPVQLPSQLQQLLKSLRKSRKMTQAEVARRLGVVQSRVADIERDPGAVSVERLLEVLAMLGAQVVVRETGPGAPVARQGPDVKGRARPKATATAKPPAKAKAKTKATPATPQDSPPDEPRGQW